MKHLALASVGIASLLLLGCDDKPKDKLPPRPVLTMVVAQKVSSTDGTPGTIEPRFQSDLAFRVLGRVIERNVKLGDQVSKGQVLAAIDPAALDFALRSAKADFNSAKAQLDNATAALERSKTLYDQGNLSAGLYEAADQARAAAFAAVQRTRTSVDKLQEQRSYAELRAEFDGVVTGVYTEVGQVPSPAQKAISIAQPDVRDAVIDITEDLAASVRIGQPFRIELQSGSAPPARGLVREINPQVDALTHTQRLKIALQDAPAAFRLGTLITAFIEKTGEEMTRVPTSAILDRDGKTFVWIVDPVNTIVSERQVEVGARDEQSTSIRNGLEPGVRIVTAGVHSLTSGQRVRLLSMANQ